MTGVQTKKLLSSINEFARLASNRSELVGACFVLVIIVMMVIPLSPVLLDILIAVNISATIVLVVSAMLLETPLKFSSFPAILLMTTLFRLALTISTTRQILLEADAGHIIQTFGEFVIGGNESWQTLRTTTNPYRRTGKRYKSFIQPRLLQPG